MPRIESDPTVRPFRARISTHGDRAYILPTRDSDAPPTEYWRGWLDGRKEANRLVAMLIAIAAGAAFTIGSTLPTLIHKVANAWVPSVP